MNQLHRHLAAVWFADLVGYTSLSERNEGEAVRLARSFQRAARWRSSPPPRWPSARPTRCSRRSRGRGEVERAIRYLEQFGPNPMVGLWLGELYEKVDRREDALNAYGWVLVGWEGADAALEPQVALARQAIARLEGLQRG